MGMINEQVIGVRVMKENESDADVAQLWTWKLTGKAHLSEHFLWVLFISPSFIHHLSFLNAQLTAQALFR